MVDAVGTVYKEGIALVGTGWRWPLVCHQRVAPNGVRATTSESHHVAVVVAVWELDDVAAGAADEHVGPVQRVA